MDIKQGKLYICSSFAGPVSPSTIVEVTQVDYINDFVLYATTNGLMHGQTTIIRFIACFEPYIPATVDEGLAHSGPKCYCGINKTYPKEDTTYMHSDWCPLYRKATT